MSYYSALTSNAKQSDWTIPSQVSSSSIFGYSSNGWKFGNASSYSSMYLEKEFNSIASVEFKLSDCSGVSPIVLITDTSKANKISFSYSGSYWILSYQGVEQQRLTKTPVKGAIYKITIDNGVITVYENDTAILTANGVAPSKGLIRLDTGSNRYTVIKDLIVQES